MEIRILAGTYYYEIFEGYFVLKLSRNGENIKTQKIYFDDIEKIQAFGNYLVLQIAGQSYIIKKDVLNPDSALMAFCGSASDKPEAKSPKDKYKAVRLLLIRMFTRRGDQWSPAGDT